MPCPHNEISIVQRSQQQSAIAAAAYQSGEKLFCEYDQQVKHYPEKRGIVHNEILLPANAPQKYADRNTLWNAAEAVEKQWNSQLARRWVLTIPREIPPDQYAVLVREFCEQQFVSKGMIADFAIHDPHPPGHNPHAHVMLTMRAMDEHGKWLPKSRKVYDLDENGERIKLPSGRWKSHKEDIGIAEVRNFIKNLSVERGKTILISSHILSEISLLADDIGIIDHGVLLEESSMDELEKKNRKYIQLQVSDIPKASLILERQFHVTDYAVQDEHNLRLYDTALDMAAINKALVVQDVAVISSQICNDTLEDYFKQITGGEGIA